MPSTFVGLALFVVFLTPGYMWVRVEERARPRPARSQLMEAAELVSVGAGMSVVSIALVSLLGSHLPPLLNIVQWTGAPDPPAYLQDNVLRGITSLLLVVLVANGASYFWAAWWLSSAARTRRARLRRWCELHLRLRPRQPPRIHVANTPWFDVLGSIDKARQHALLSVTQDSGAVITGRLASYDVSAGSDDQVLALQGPIKRQRPGDDEPYVVLDEGFVLLPSSAFREVYVAEMLRDEAERENSAG